MTKASKQELRRLYHQKYRRANRSGKTRVLNEFCELTGYHRKHAIALLKELKADAAVAASVGELSSYAK